MESTLLSICASKMPIQSISRSSNSIRTPITAKINRHQLSAARAAELGNLRVSYCVGYGSGSSVRSRSRLPFSVRSYASGGGGGGSGGVDGGGGGGDGGAEGGEAEQRVVTRGDADDDGLSSDVIVLGVGGMTCGGCAASVKKILESQPQVSSADVNLETETAIVWPVSEVKATPNWRKDIGEALAQHLTNCGFKSSLKEEGGIES